MKNVTLSGSGRLRAHLSSVVMATALGMAAPALAAEKTTQLDIAEQALSEALIEFGAQSGIAIAFTQEQLANLRAPKVSGKYSLNDALEILLKESGLVYQFISEDTIRIESADKGNKKEESQESDEKDDVTEEIIVTGSRIARTPSQMAANVLILDGDELRASGESTLEGALRTLPQNMFGASPVGATARGSLSVNGAINVTAISTINLRGLGSESTLVLIDGRRIGKAGMFGGVSDITGIPLRAIERVEILLDGASSIYGSDAVGGVVNIIMKKDYQGLEITHEYSAPISGGFEEHIFTAMGGFSWDSGQLSATYQHFQSSNLDGEERPESVAHSEAFNPGTVTNMVLYTYQGQSYLPHELRVVLGLPADTPWWAIAREPGVTNSFLSVRIPEGQDGTNLSFEDFIPIDRSNPHEVINPDASEGLSLIPASQNDSLDVTFDQSLALWGREVTLSGTVHYSQRQVYSGEGGFNFLVRGIPETDPSNVFGQPVSISWYAPELGAQHYETDEQTARWGLSLEGSAGETWNWRIDAGQSRIDADTNYFNQWVGHAVTLDLIENEGLNLLASDLVAANSPDILSRLVAPELPMSSLNEESTLGLDASGTLFSLPGGYVRMAFGVDWRQEGLETESSRAITQSGINFPFGEEVIGAVTTQSLPFGAFSEVESKTQRSGYAELFVPVVGSGNRMVGVERLNVTGSARYDAYHEQGSGSTWSLGLIWDPIDQITVKLSQRTSFTASTFRERLRETLDRDVSSFGISYPILNEDGQVVGFEPLGRTITGGNPDLKPTTSSIQTLSLSFSPEILPGFTATATLSETDSNNVIGSPFRGPFFDYVDYIALYPNLSRDERGFLVLDARSVNIGGVERAGVDYLFKYRRDTNFGQFNASLNVGRTTKYNIIQAPGATPVNHVASVEFASNTVVQPYRYSANLGWHYQGLSVNLAASTASKTVSTTVDSFGEPLERRTVSPALHANLTMAYDFEEGSLFAVPGWLQDTSVRIVINNVLDDYTETRFFNVRTGEPNLLSELNANVVDSRGRMFRLSLTKSF